MEIPTLTRAELLAKWQPVIDQTFDIFTWTSGHELAFLAECASRADSIVEIGSYHGKSAKIMSLANPKAKILAIDKPQDLRCQRILEINLTNSGVYIFSGDSREAVPALAQHGGIKFAFIDGGHLEADVTHDIGVILGFMAPGGIIAGHDWRHNNPLDGVNVAVEKAFDRHKIHVFESIWHVKL